MLQKPFFAILFSASLLVTMSALAQTPAPVAPVNPASAPVTRDQIPALVREALVNDPTIIKDAVEKMQEKQEAELKKQAKEGIVKNKADIFFDATSPSVGAVSADVTVVEFFDYHCGHCKNVLPSIVELLAKDKKVKVVFKEFPILSEDSVLASRAAIAVYRLDKDKYFDFHKAIFAIKGRYDEKTLLAEAKKLGINEAKLKAEIAKPEIDAVLDKNRKLAEALGVRGTPAIIIGEDLFPGEMPYNEMQKAVDGVRNPSKKPADAPAIPTPSAPEKP